LVTIETVLNLRTFGVCSVRKAETGVSVRPAFLPRASFLGIAGNSPPQLRSTALIAGAQKSLRIEALHRSALEVVLMTLPALLFRSSEEKWAPAMFFMTSCAAILYLCAGL
jgi:hypothetical protein